VWKVHFLAKVDPKATQSDTKVFSRGLGRVSRVETAPKVGNNCVELTFCPPRVATMTSFWSGRVSAPAWPARLPSALPEQPAAVCRDQAGTKGESKLATKPLMIHLKLVIKVKL